MKCSVHLSICLLAFFSLAGVESRIRHYKFDIVLKNATKLCSTKSIITVNGKFPGPALYAREDDNVVVRVTNHCNYNITIHWHGVRQIRTGWSDGPAYITQCPIQPGQNFIYNFTLTGQRGTLLWHAHISWIRATAHGAIVILPRKNVPYPFPQPDDEKIIVLAEWWKSDVENVVDQATQTGLPPNVSDAHTINGHSGPRPGCSVEGMFKLKVESGKRYLLRIINAALNEELFFKIAGHDLTVVEVDATYTKPFKTDVILISPGQTTSALLMADQSIGKYIITASPFMDAPVPINNSTAMATLQYKWTASFNPPIILASIPPQNATSLANAFIGSLRSLNSKYYPSKVPQAIDHSLFLTIAVGINPCSTCISGNQIVASINNLTFVMPSIALLQAHYYNIHGVFTDDFPGNPPFVFNYTGKPPDNIQTSTGTKVYKLAYNSTVQVVIQDTAIIAPESHPIHLHGFNFFVVGRGLGNYDPNEDPKKFNLVDPVERNTVGVPNGGWSALRFQADNPGIWFLHCHLEVHTTWGLKMAFMVENGKGPNESLQPPPMDLPQC